MRRIGWLVCVLAGCGSNASSDVQDVPSVPVDGNEIATDSAADTHDAAPLDANDATADAVDAQDVIGDSALPPSGIAHVIVVYQENHTFDAYFGRYCTAAAGSAPTCNDGPACCEAAPAHDPSGGSPVVLDDTENGAYDPNHGQACELAEIHGGAMDRFVTGASCSNPRNFAIASNAVVAPYFALAQNYALADRYFQPIAGATSSNDMYLAVAHEVFIDNSFIPRTVGARCVSGAPTMQYTARTIADVLRAAGHSAGVYAEGYAAAVAAGPAGCATAPPDCPAHANSYPCIFDPSDIPFQYYAPFADQPTFMHDFSQFAHDLAAGTLPDVAFVKAIGYRTEHPGGGTRISDGANFVQSLVQSVMASPYGSSTLVLVTWDEGGGFFDHIAPPATSSADGYPYGTRVPLLAIGPFARRNFVSHVTMEHSSIVRFLEWNFTGNVGQLATRDAVVNNIGSLLDPTRTGIPVPAN